MTRALMRYHPRVGHLYMPGAKHRVEGAGGGYLVQTNAAGFRSDREFITARKPKVFRALIFGDSQTAGDGCANAERFSDLVEQFTPGLEIYNYGLTGSGPDQQFIAYQECAGVEHNLLIIALYVENIRRVNKRLIRSRNSSGAEVFSAKPYFQIEGGELVLRNVPAPKQLWTQKSLPDELAPFVYSYEETNFFSRSDRPRRQLGLLEPMRASAKNIAMRLARFEPLTDYDAPDRPGWLLLRRILEAWIDASKTPVLLVTIPHYVYFTRSSSRARYQARFRELADAAGCRLYDPLPDIRRLSTAARSALWCDSFGHLSRRGHQAMAELLAPVIGTLMRESCPAFAAASTERAKTDAQLPSGDG